MGEFERRIQEELDRTVRVDSHKFNLDLFQELVLEAKKEFPDTTEITQAFTMISNLFPESHAFSKRHLEKFMTKLREATIKWFMESADGEKQ